MSYPYNVILWGGTGAAKEARPCIEQPGRRVIAVFDDTPNLPSPFLDVSIYHGWESFEEFIKDYSPNNKLGFCIAIGNPHGNVRLNLSKKLKECGLIPVSFAHYSAVIANDSYFGEGYQVLAGAIIDPNVRIGNQCIINLNSVVGHDTIIEDGSEVGPSATVCGSVHIGTNTWIGAGATIMPKIKIGNNSIIGMGSVVIRDVEDNVTMIGNPARKLKDRNV